MSTILKQAIKPTPALWFVFIALQTFLAHSLSVFNSNKESKSNNRKAILFPLKETLSKLPRWRFALSIFCMCLKQTQS